MLVQVDELWGVLTSLAQFDPGGAFGPFPFLFGVANGMKLSSTDSRWLSGASWEGVKSEDRSNDLNLV